MKIIINVLGPVQTNSYFIINEDINETFIIDPEEDAHYIIKKCKELQVKPVAILLTHGHFDHVGAVGDLKELLKLPVYAGAEEEKLLADPALNGSAKLGRTPLTVKTDKWLKDGEITELAGFFVKTIATPGHTSGSVCYYIENENVLFCGDTLFNESFGRTDFPTGSQEKLADSIINKLFTLPDETVVYPGHGGSTTIRHEKENNPIYHCR
ncbi:MAG: MBL fold metallo-hydrolase [Oscillospiraceae bacterium]|nr:MBL fold metallo-hydrolase [Oscillospiraceae bacterium]